MLVLMCLRREEGTLPTRAESLGENAIALSAFDDSVECEALVYSLFMVEQGQSWRKLKWFIQ